MIASYLHNFIFLKPRKVGGTTVEAVLAPSCGPEDVVTPLGRSDEKLRSGDGPPLCRNFAEPELEIVWRDAFASGDFSALENIKRKRQSLLFNAHMTALEVRRALDQKFWKSACKLSITRHPYEKAVSFAFFNYTPGKLRFEEFLDQAVRRGNYVGAEHYAIKGKIVLDEVIRLESLHADLKRVGAGLGIPVPDTLPRFKSQSRTDRRPASEILTLEQKAIVAEFCAWEFEQFGYER